MIAEQLFCYGCARHYPAGTEGARIADSKGNVRWCCSKCANAKSEAARSKGSLSGIRKKIVR